MDDDEVLHGYESETVFVAKDKSAVMAVAEHLRRMGYEPDLVELPPRDSGDELLWSAGVRHPVLNDAFARDARDMQFTQLAKDHGCELV